MSKFHAHSHYQAEKGEAYRLLPFNFTPLDDSRYVLTNIVGEYAVLPRQELHDLIKHRLSPSATSYADLVARHFLMESNSDVALDLLALKARTKFRRLSNFTALHLFVVTLRCEHSCPYCQVSRQNDDQTTFDMSRETAERSVDLVFKSPSPSIKIEFQGGEPLLNFPLIKFVVELAEERNKVEKRNLGFVIATNLAVINDEMLRFCREHEIHLSTSLDGPATLHNKNRPRPGGDSYERAMSGVEKARAALGRDAVSAVMTTTLASLEQPREIIDEYVARRFHGIFLRPLSPYGFAIKTKWYKAYDRDRWLRFYFEGLDYIIELNKQGLHFIEFFASTVLAKMLTPFQPGYVDLMNPAGIGIGALVYNYNGTIYASDESRMLAEMGDQKFALGNVHTDSHKDIFTSDALLDPLEASFTGSVPMCSTCAFEPYCGAEPVYHYATQGDFIGLKPTSDFCNRNMAIFRGLIERMEADADTREVFTRWAYS